MDLTTITAAVGCAKAATDILKTLTLVANDTEVKEKVIELQNVVLDLQSNLLSLQVDYSNLIKDNEQLESELKHRDDWEELTKHYKLTEVSPMQYVYASIDADPEHWLCPACFSEKKKHLLQMWAESPDSRTYRCNNCKSCRTQFSILNK